MEEPEIKRFGRYEILAELGRGAMGVVYKARDPQIDRLVAVKTVPLWGQDPDQEKEFRLRFMNEAQAAGRLHHSGIVGVFDVGENPENHDPYIVLEYVDGEVLNRILAREKKLPLATALELALEIAGALDYAHTQGVIHRDIKPANILVTRDSHAKIADFGIAKLNLAHFTLPGRVLGTPAYMAPEQLSGEGADGRSDLFSLGVILYVMVTGHSPFQGDSATTVCFKVTNREPISPSALDMTLPSVLDAVVARAMAKNPDERYQRGAEFADDLRQLQQQFCPVATRPESATTSRAVSGFGTGSAGAREATASNSRVRPAAAAAQAGKFVRHVLWKAPVRDLLLGAATVILLLVVGRKSRLWVGSSKAGSNHAATVLNNERPPLTPRGTDSRSKPAQPATGPEVVAVPGPRSHPKVVHAATEEVLVPSSMLDLSVHHQFKDATLFVWVDHRLEFTRPLHGGEQKRLVVFGGIHGVDSETLKIPAGKHVLRFRALSADRSVDLSKTVAADFVGGHRKSLLVTFDHHNTSMRLTWQ